MLVLVFLLGVNLVFTFLQPALVITTGALLVTGFVALATLINGPWRIPPLLDVAFVFAAIFYFVMPGLFFLAYPEENQVSTMPLQQALIGSTIATFLLARRLSGWRSWRAVVGRLETERDQVLSRPLAFALIVAAIVWSAAALPGLSQWMSIEYGSRQVEQRSDMTIPLLGFNLLAIVGMTLLTQKLMRTSRPRLWWLFGFALFAFYGVVCVFVFGARTRLVWALLLPAVSLLVFRRLTLRTVVVASLVVIALLPVFNVIGKTRHMFHIGRPSLQEMEAVGFEDDFRSVARDSEMVAMAPLADQVIRRFDDEIMFGRYIGWSIIQAPPAFLLRPVGLDETQSLSGRFTRTYYPEVWHRGGAYGMSLAAESYCNLRELGGIFTGVVLCLFIVFFERAILARVPFVLALALTADFMIAIARANRVSLESLPKAIAVSAVMLALIKLCQFLTNRSTVPHARRRAV